MNKIMNLRKLIDLVKYPIITDKATKLLELNATSPFVGDVFFRTRLGYSQSGGFQGPDYSYKYLMEELIFSF
jgi:hypothetical protein